jgi:DNA-binding response OmpR family regulator
MTPARDGRVLVVDDEPQIVDTLARGAFDYLRKPFDFEVLARVVAAAVIVA